MERVRERREAQQEQRAIQKRKRECLGDCRKELGICNRSCQGLSSIAICKRSCRDSFVSCEFDCAAKNETRIADQHDIAQHNC